MSGVDDSDDRVIAGTMNHDDALLRLTHPTLDGLDGLGAIGGGWGWVQWGTIGCV